MTTIGVIVAVVATILKIAESRPDSAGMVEMVNGLAYGGIPYGSVSGMLGTQMLRHTADYYPQNKMMNDQEMMSNYEMDEDENQGHEESMPQAEISPMSTMFILPNMRAPNFDKRSQGPVQIYKFPAVVGPNKVAMVTGMAF